MAEIAENEEKVFKFYFQMPRNVRMGIIDEMKPDDRCRFTRCSSQCNEEAKSSKNYIYELEVSFFSENHTRIRVYHGDYNLSSYEDYGYVLLFVERSEEKLLVYTSLDQRTSWEIELSSSANLFQLAIEEFNQLLFDYQRIIKALCIDGKVEENCDAFKNIDFGIESLDNLEDLELYFSRDIAKIITKTRKPLKRLYVEGVDSLAEYEQVYQVEDYIRWFVPCNDNKIFQRFTAKIIKMNIGQLTEKDIFQFVRSWQNGTGGKDIRKYTWNIDNSKFERQKLLKRLRVGEDDREEGTIEIKHFKHFGKRAKFSHDEDSLEFSTYY